MIGHGLAVARRPAARERWDRLIALGFAIGSACFFIAPVLFGTSAVASYVVPSTGSVLDLAAVNWCTALGALCFFVGALMLLPRKPTVLKEA